MDTVELAQRLAELENANGNCVAETAFNLLASDLAVDGLELTIDEDNQYEVRVAQK